MPLQNQVAVTFTTEQLTQIRTAIKTLNSILKTSTRAARTPKPHGTCKNGR